MRGGRDPDHPPLDPENLFEVVVVIEVVVVFPIFVFFAVIVEIVVIEVVVFVGIVANRLDRRFFNMVFESGECRSQGQSP
jgi:hypothetical protein